MWVQIPKNTPLAKPIIKRSSIPVVLIPQRLAKRHLITLELIHR